MRRKIQRRPITLGEVNEARAIIAAAPWKQSTSEHYKDAPHSYIIKQWPNLATSWDRLAELIKVCGTIRTWRNNPMRYLVIDGMCYWVMWPVLNRAEAKTLDGYETWGQFPAADV